MNNNQPTPTRHFFDYFNERIPQNWNEPAITDFDGTMSYTFGEMVQKMARIQIMLNQAGIGRGDKVVICGKNCANWAISFLSIAANRGVIVSIMDAFVGADIEKLTNHSDAKAMFVGESVWKKINIKKLKFMDKQLHYRIKPFVVECENIIDKKPCNEKVVLEVRSPFEIVFPKDEIETDNGFEVQYG
mgnify:CR=1 FL=1